MSVETDIRKLLMSNEPIKVSRESYKILKALNKRFKKGDLVDTEQISEAIRKK